MDIRSILGCLVMLAFLIVVALYAPQMHARIG